jgi:hypothetical protein
VPFAATPADCHLARPEVVAFSAYQGMKYCEGPDNPFGVTRRVVSTLRLGQTVYTLRKPAEGTFYADFMDEGGEFMLEGFPHPFVGWGPRPEDAFQDWLKQFHAIFQRLYAMQPFEMDEVGRRLWGVIDDQVTVEAYRAKQPLIVRQQGKVKRGRKYPELILWEDGTRERVQIGRMPGEFASYKVGQPFEALVYRDPVSHKLLKMEYVKRLPSPARTDKEEAKRLWDSLPPSSSLPDTTWD